MSRELLVGCLGRPPSQLTLIPFLEFGGQNPKEADFDLPSGTFRGGLGTCIHRWRGYPRGLQFTRVSFWLGPEQTEKKNSGQTHRRPECHLLLLEAWLEDVVLSQLALEVC